MSKDFATYKSFFDSESAKEFTELLKEEEIPYTLEGNELMLSSSITGTGMAPKAVVKISPANFEKVNKLIETEILNKPIAEYSEHYLAEFDHEELMDIIKNPVEWSIEDRSIARLMLQDADENIDLDTLDKIQQQELEKEREGKSISNALLVGYFLLVLAGVSFIVFTLGGLGMLYYSAFGKSTDIHGTKYFIYNEKARNKSKKLFYISMGLVIAGLLFLFIMGMPFWYSYY